MTKPLEQPTSNAGDLRASTVETGPLHGVTVVEIAGIGPGPFAAMLLADMGADVICIDRPDRVRAPRRAAHHDLLRRGRRSIAIDLKTPSGVVLALDLIQRADVLIEGYRPGVMERLGLGPDVCLAQNPRLVFARMTGWGQDGPYADSAGHDINYIAASGVLAHIGTPIAGPTPPLNLVGDFGGGGMLLAYGIAAALLKAARTGAGDVIDCSMADGSALLMTMFWSLRSGRQFDEERLASNLLDGGSPFYRVYECSDGKHVAVGAIEPKFYAQLLELTGLVDDVEASDQYRRDGWPALQLRLAAAFKSRTRDEWAQRAQGFDACVSPVLTMTESLTDAHHVARRTFEPRGGIPQPGAAPRFARSKVGSSGLPVHPGQNSLELLRGLGISDERLADLVGSGTVAQMPEVRDL